MRPHPAVAHLAFTRVLASDAGLVVAERVLGLLGEAGFPPERAAELGGFLLCSIITLVAAERSARCHPGASRTSSRRRTRWRSAPTRTPTSSEVSTCSSGALSAFSRTGPDRPVPGR
jgi:hypothetical protein